MPGCSSACPGKFPGRTAPMPRGVRLLLAAGGTGGHLFPGIAVAEAARRALGAEVLFVGTAGGMEKEVIPRLGFTLRLTPSGQRRGCGWWGAARALWAAVRWLKAAWRVVREFAPDLIFSIGGYVSGRWCWPAGPGACPASSWNRM